MKTLHVAVARHLHETDFQVRVLQIIESVFYRLSSPCFTDYRVRVLHIIESVFYRLSSPCFTDFQVRVLQIFKSVTQQ